MSAAARRGDVVFTAGPVHPPAPTRGPWTEAGRPGGAWTAWTSTPAPGWAGYHLTSVSGDGWDGWFVGERTGGDPGPAASALLAATAAGDEPTADRLAAALHGSWMLYAVDRAGLLHVWSDRFGTLHGFAASAGDRHAVGTVQNACAAAVGPGELDWVALAGWSAMGFFPGDRTADERVRVVRPATHAVFAADGPGPARRYWWWAPEPDGARSMAATVTALDDVLAEVLGEQAEGTRLAIPISGGLDSRTTAAVLTAHDGRRRGAELWAYSYGYEAHSVETRIGARIAAARHLPFEAWTIEPYLFDQLDRASSALEGAQDLTQTRQLGVVDRVARHADHVLAAHWGDVWLDDMGGAASAVGPDAVLAEVRAKFTKPGGRWLLDTLVGPRLADPDAAIEAVLRDEFAPYRDLGPVDAQARAFKTDQWSFRWTVPSLRAYHAGLTPVLPFYDGRVADLLLTVAPPLVAGRALQIEHLRRTAPDLALITWQHSGTPLERSHWERTWERPVRYARGGARRARALVAGHPVLSRNWEVQFGGADGAARLRAQLTRPDAPLADLVAPAVAGALLDRLAASPHDAELGYAASMLCTFSAWLDRR